jgi:hypothetical protein
MASRLRSCPVKTHDSPSVRAYGIYHFVWGFDTFYDEVDSVCPH